MATQQSKGTADLNGIQKAAILMIALGPERSSKLFQYLKEEEIESLTLEIANTKSVDQSTKDAIIDEFYELCLAQQYIAEGGIGYAKELLEKALGDERAIDVIGRLTASLQVRPFEFVRKTDPTQLLNFIQDEHPQTIALILSYLAPAQSAQIIGALPPEKQADVAKRIALMDRTSPDVIQEVERVLEKKLASLVNQDYTSPAAWMLLLTYSILLTAQRRSISSKPSKSKSPSWLTRSARRCSYSKTSCCWTTSPYSVFCVRSRTPTWPWHSREPANRYRKLSSTTCPSVWLR